MTTTRQDAWTQDEDLLLAEVVLRHIREGGTQLAAFEEVGRRLSRTAAACGFRWNSFVRKQYKSGIELAKKQRKELKKDPEVGPEHYVHPKEKSEESSETHFSLTMAEVITFLQQYQQAQQQYNEIIEENHDLKKKITQFEDKVKQLEQEKQVLANNIRVVEEDYQALIEIMERARKMVVLQDDERNRKVKFQMDKNGNLERVEK